MRRFVSRQLGGRALHNAAHPAALAGRLVAAACKDPKGKKAPNPTERPL